MITDSRTGDDQHSEIKVAAKRFFFLLLFFFYVNLDRKVPFFKVVALFVTAAEREP